uniref:Ribosomal_L11 domain-containing protein n=1 Tax=Strongyloides papillosus TaxID=174720 RepID=A0A0N5BJJ4_STREA
MAKAKQQTKEKEKAIPAKSIKEGKISKPEKEGPQPATGANQVANSGSNHHSAAAGKAKMLYSLPPNFEYGPLVRSEKLEVSKIKGKMETGNPTPDGREVWKVNKELFVVTKTKNGISELERYKPISLKGPSAATVRFLIAAKKITTAIENTGQKVLNAIDAGILALQNGENFKSEELMKLLKYARNDVGQVISPSRAEAIGKKFDQMKDEIMKSEPKFMSTELARKMAKIDILETPETIVIEQ